MVIVTTFQKQKFFMDVKFKRVPTFEKRVFSNFPLLLFQQAILFGSIFSSVAVSQIRKL